MGPRSTGGGAGAATGLPAGAHHAGAATLLHGLLPAWLQIIGVVLFALIAASHVRHVLHSDGQRRSWHACHVLMALSMIFMYAPTLAGDVLGITTFWRAVLASAGLLAALWALWGNSGAINPVWLLTALDLGVMFFMWSAPASRTAVTVLVTLYLLMDAVLWAVDAHRVMERAPSLLRWLPVAGSSGATTFALPAAVARADALLGDLDIGPSMVVMSLGMAYMVAAMS